MSRRPQAALLPMSPPRPSLLLLLLLLLPVIALAGGHHQHHHHRVKDRDSPAKYEATDDDHEDKTISPYNGHSLFDLSTLGVLAALKTKFVVVVLIAVAVFVLLTKGYNTKCLFGNCRPNYSTYGYYPYVDYTYVGYEVPAGAAGAASAYRRPAAVMASPVVGVGAKDSHHLTDLTARVWNSIDIAGMAFSALNIQEDDCRRKLVCQADRAAASNPLLRAALSWFSTSLARYRTDRSRLGAGAGDRGGAEWRQDQGPDPCEELYPRCLHRALPPALGGPDPDRPLVYLADHPHHLHHHHVEHGEHDILALGEPLTEAWRATDFRHEYRYEYPHPHPPFRGGGEAVSGVPSPPAVVVADLDALYPSSASPTFATQVAHARPGTPTVNSYAAVLASAAASPASATVLAPVHEDTPANALEALGLANVSTTTTSVGESPSLSAPVAAPESPSPPEPRSPTGPTPAVLSLLSPATHAHGGTGASHTTPGATAEAPAEAPAALVWRRVLFGNRSKLHHD